MFAGKWKSDNAIHPEGNVLREMIGIRFQFSDANGWDWQKDGESMVRRPLQTPSSMQWRPLYLKKDDGETIEL